MDFYISTILKGKNIIEAEAIVVEKLKEHGFGIVSEIDMQQTFKNKLNVDFKPYKILGACNPDFAYQALSKADKIGVLLPCNVCLQQLNDSDVEVFAVNPLEAMKAVNSKEVELLATDIYNRLNVMIKSL